MRTKLIFSLLITATLVYALAQSTVSQTPTGVEDVVRVDTDLTTLLFTATDKDNRFITTLQEADLRLTENSELQKIVTFQRETDRPLSIAFLIDVSGSEERSLPQEKAAARTFIETVIKANRDEAAIIAFAGPTFLEQKLTGDIVSLTQALGRVEAALPKYPGPGRPINGLAASSSLRRPPPGGTTAIWEAIVLTVNEVLARDSSKLGLNQKRRAIILLTDGRDTSSRLNMQEAVASALAAETIIYPIGIGDGQQEGIDSYALETLAESTGGRAFFPKKDSDLHNAFAEIELELRSQYLITYSPTNKLRDGSFRQLHLWLINPRLQKEKVQLRYRPGYFAKPRDK